MVVTKGVSADKILPNLMYALSFCSHHTSNRLMTSQRASWWCPIPSSIVGRQQVVRDRVNFKTPISVQFWFQGVNVDSFQNSLGEVTRLPFQYLYAIPSIWCPLLWPTLWSFKSLHIYYMYLLVVHYELTSINILFVLKSLQHSFSTSI